MRDEETVPSAELRRQRRLEQQAARSRRRRLAAFGVALALAAVIVASVLALSGNGSPRRAAPRSAPLVAAAAVRVGTRHRPGEPAAKPARPGRAPVPILMYHVIAPPFANSPFPGLYVPSGEFAAQMQALDRAGFHAVTLDAVRSFWLHGTRLPPHPIVLSFDNGYHTQYTKALPILRRLGWVGVENLQLSGLPPSQGGLSRREVKALLAAGWELDTQGFTHADLITLDPGELHYQVAVARRALQRLYGVPVNWFCYPSGHYNGTVVAAVRAAGYVGATTVVPGWSRPTDDPYRLPRIRVLGGTTPTELLTLVADASSASPPPTAYPLAG
jgi:peptidoglycan/xylan/chitin deacetylase (PgdA/CDA1 family)